MNSTNEALANGTERNKRKENVFFFRLILYQIFNMYLHTLIRIYWALRNSCLGESELIQLPILYEIWFQLMNDWISWIFQRVGNFTILQGNALYSSRPSIWMSSISLLSTHRWLHVEVKSDSIQFLLSKLDAHQLSFLSSISIWKICRI